MNVPRLVGMVSLSVMLFAAAASETRTCTHCNCLTSATTNGGTLIVCPAGDGPTLADIGAAIEVTVLDFAGLPVPGMPAADFWIAGLNGPYTLCGSFQSSSADGPTDVDGRTTISGSIAAGGFFESDVHVIAAGWPVQAAPECHSPLPLVLVSPDMNGDLVVDIIDLAMFALSFPPNAYAEEADMDGNGVVDLVDLAALARHWQHSCGQ